MMNEKYHVSGMTCSACSSRVEKCVGKLEGIQDVSVNLLTNSMQVKYEENLINSSKIIEAVEHAGYGAIPAEESTVSSALKQESGKSNQTIKEAANMRYRLILSFVFLLPMMYISMGPMLHHMLHIPVPDFIKEVFYGNKNAVIFSFSQFILLLPVLFLNQKYFKSGFGNLFRGSPNMDSLIAIGSGASVLYGIFAVFRIGYGLGHNDMELVSSYSGDLYFESAGMILTLITLGKYLESKSKGKTSKAIEQLMNLAPKQATVQREGKVSVIPVRELVKDDIILIKPGESIAADGIILEGTTSMDESVITGESIPVEKKIGDPVVSAAINKTGFIKIRAKKVGKDTTISQIIRLVEDASASKAPIAKLADKIAGVFVPIVMGIALAAVLIWLIAGADFEFALSTGIAVLVISCPCALGLATPVAIMVGTGKGAENGILIKSGEALEVAHSIDTVVMDKTGTITQGRPTVTDILPIGIGKNKLAGIAAGMESGSEHPLAEAIMNYAQENQIKEEKMQEFKAVFGRGIQTTQDGVCYYAGNEAFMKEIGRDIGSIKETVDSLADEGKTPLIFANETEFLGIIGVADVEKPESSQAIALFKKMNIDVVMLTGDNKRTARAVQRRLNIPNVIAEVMPEDKEKHILSLQEKGHKVAMIGDGINDAPALARADIGIAIGAGTDIAIESADAVLISNNLLHAVSAVRLSKAVIRNIKENLFWAFFYNTIGIPVAAGVLYPVFGIKLSPMFGAAAMSMSSICVVLNALRLRFFKANNLLPEKLNIKNNNIQEKRKMKKELVIEGMMCDHCKKHVEEALNAMDGVTEAVVELADKKAYVTLEKEIPMDEFAKVIDEEGYTLIQS